MAVDVDAVAAYFDDATFKYVTWEKAGDLQTTKRLIEMHVFHVQNAGNLPNLVTFSNDVLVGGRLITDGFVARNGNVPPAAPEAAFESFFKKASTQQIISAELPDPAAACTNTMEAAFYGSEVDDATFEDLRLRALAKSRDVLRAGTPPLEGTY